MINSGQKLVNLLKLIRAITHEHDEMKQGIMTYLEHDLEWKLNFQRGHKPLADFYKEFKARADMIDTFKGRVGYYPKLFAKHKADLALFFTHPKQVVTLTKEEIKKAMQLVCEEYKESMFVLISMISCIKMLRRLWTTQSYSKT